MEFHEGKRKWRSGAFCAGDFDIGGARVHIGRRKDRQYHRRRGQDQRGAARDLHLVGVRVSAEALTQNPETIGKQRELRNRFNFH